MTQRWLAASLTSGAVILDAVAFEPQWPLRRSLSNYDTATGTYYLDHAPPDWQQAIAAGVSVLAMYDEDDEQRSIQWAGYITHDDPDSARDAVDLNLTTLEGYLDRRYVGDITYAVTNGWQRDTVIADLVAKYVNTAGSIPGVPIQVVQCSSGGPALTVDLVLQNADNATVLTRINELIGQYGGEFAIEWTWAADGKTLVPVLFVGDHIGTASSTGVPSVTLEQPGPILSVRYPTDYSAGAGANICTAYSSGQGKVTPYSPTQQVADFAGRPAFEDRFQPKASEPDVATLTKYAQQRLAVLSPGAQPLTVTLALEALSAGRRFGLDWAIGDDLGWAVDPCKAFPQGLSGVGRVIAAEFTDDKTLTPIFADPSVYTGVI